MKLRHVGVGRLYVARLHRQQPHLEWLGAIGAAYGRLLGDITLLAALTVACGRAVGRWKSAR